ncbi:MAG: ABC transporter ATP-binding protein [Gammaproteobacteria bacterium]|nr:ABC transporter ATP-binding protein [Gammaproteobacteria bacterium]NNJ90241.1 ABC transporter ATP-binding protein [Gammaproteobacteria bacterium]
MNDYVLQVSQLQKSFGAVKATNNLSLEIERGQVHALIGPNGAGKTTLIKQLCGELIPDSGTILFNNKNITAFPMPKRALLGMGRSFQVTSVFQQLTVKENIALAVQAHHGHSFHFWKPASKEETLEQATMQAMQRCGLLARADTIASSLSHGEMRQLDVGMALAGKPELLLLDEPMAGMGSGGSLKMTELIQELKGNTSVLLIEHDMQAVFSLADRITVLVYGEAIATGTAEEIQNNPQVQRAYLGDEQDNA